MFLKVPYSVLIPVVAADADVKKMDGDDHPEAMVSFA